MLLFFKVYSTKLKSNKHGKINIKQNKKTSDTIDCMGKTKWNAHTKKNQVFTNEITEKKQQTKKKFSFSGHTISPNETKQTNRINTETAEAFYFIELNWIQNKSGSSDWHSHTHTSRETKNKPLTLASNRNYGNWKPKKKNKISILKD